MVTQNFCPNCGTDISHLSPEAQACLKCGHPLRKSNSEQTPSIAKMIIATLLTTGLMNFIAYSLPSFLRPYLQPLLALAVGFYAFTFFKKAIQGQQKQSIEQIITLIIAVFFAVSLIRFFADSFSSSLSSLYFWGIDSFTPSPKDLYPALLCLSVIFALLAFLIYKQIKKNDNQNDTNNTQNANQDQQQNEGDNDNVYP